MKLYHGEDTIASRQALIEFKQEQAAAGLEVNTFSGKDLSLADLRQATESLDLLGTQRAVIIEGLFAAPKSRRSDELLSYLKTAQTEAILLWEKKKVNANRFKPLNLEAREFTLPKILFSWLESLSPGNPQGNLKLYRQLADSQPVEVLAYMMARQIRQLLTAKFEPELLTGPSWITGKIVRQAGSFSEAQLFDWHHQLYLIDKEIKTGQSLLPLNQRLAQLLISG
jgi:hypothetical protein